MKTLLLLLGLCLPFSALADDTVGTEFIIEVSGKICPGDHGWGYSNVCSLSRIYSRASMTNDPPYDTLPAGRTMTPVLCQHGSSNTATIPLSATLFIRFPYSCENQHKTPWAVATFHQSGSYTYTNVGFSFNFSTNCIMEANLVSGRWVAHSSISPYVRQFGDEFITLEQVSSEGEHNPIFMPGPVITIPPSDQADPPIEFLLHFNDAQDTVYGVYATDSLNSTNWTWLTNLTTDVEGNGGGLVPASSVANSRYYRLTTTNSP